METTKKTERLVVAECVDRGVLLATGNPDVFVMVFARDWNEVDRARAIIRARGLEHRLRVHHRLARSYPRVA